MFKPKINCTVCAAVQANKKLLNRIYNSTAFLPHSQDTLKNIAEDCQELFSYESLRNHVKKHQFLNQTDMTRKTLQHLAKKSESKLVKRQIESIDIWDTVITDGLARVEAGEVEVNVNQLLKAAKDKSDFQMKQKDQELNFMNMIWHFASGENTDNAKIYDRRIIDAEALADYHITERPAAYPDSE